MSEHSNTAIARSLNWVILGVAITVVDISINHFDLLPDTIGKLLSLVGIMKMISSTTDYIRPILRIAGVLLALAIPVNLRDDNLLHLSSAINGTLSIVSSVGVVMFCEAMLRICRSAGLPIARAWALARAIAGIGAVVFAVLSPSGSSVITAPSSQGNSGFAAVAGVLLVIGIIGTFWLLISTRNRLE